MGRGERRIGPKRIDWVYPSWNTIALRYRWLVMCLIKVCKSQTFGVLSIGSFVRRGHSCGGAQSGYLQSTRWSAPIVSYGADYSVTHFMKYTHWARTLYSAYRRCNAIMLYLYCTAVASCYWLGGRSLHVLSPLSVDGCATWHCSVIVDTPTLAY